MLTNMHNPPEDSNFCDEHGNAIEPATVEQWNWYTGHMNREDRTAVIPSAVAHEGDKSTLLPSLRYHNFE